MIKVLINNEEVVSNHNLEIKEEMLSTSSTILKNCYPKVWENDKDYVSRFYYPKDYSKCKIYNLPKENTTQEQTGTNLSFETYTGKSTIEDIKFYGNTQQNGTPTPSSPVPIQSVTGLQNVNVCGKNLLNAGQESYTFSQGENIRTNIGTIQLEANTKYYISYNVDTQMRSNTRSTPYLTIVGTYNYSYQDAGTNKNLTTGRKVWEFTPTISGTYEFGYWSHTPNVDLTVSNFMISKSNNTTYEPYKGNTYEVNLGKNLLPITTQDFTINDVNFKAQNGKIILNGTSSSQINGSYFKNNNNKFPIYLEPGTYTISRTDVGYSVGLVDSNLTQYVSLSKNSTNLYKSFTITEKKTYYLYFYISQGEIINNQEYSIQIEKGSQATSFSPYFTPIELNKIGNYQDRIYKDNDTWYVEKQIGKKIIDGSSGSYSNTSTNRFNIDNLITDFKKSEGYNLSLSNYYKSFNQVGTNAIFNTLVSNENYAFDFSSATSYTLRFKDTRFTNVNDFKTWLTTHNLEVLYVLATPEITEITNQELINQLENLNIQLYEGQTNFIISGSLPMPTYIKIYTNFEELIFCGFTKNTGNVSLNPREFHGVDLQILDFKDLLSTGETLNYVIANKTITEAINQVVNSISDYGFVVGEIQLLNPNEMIGAYSTLNKTAYDVFQYIADITQSRWTTRMIDENTIAIDFYDPSLMPTGVDIDKTQTFYENYKIIDMSFNYSTNDYRNKQIMTSDEVYANITQTETIIADGYATSFMCQNKIGLITSITLNGVEKTFATKSEQELGITADFIYQPGDTTFTSNNSIGAGGVIVITYYPIVKGREIILNNTESDRIENQINRNGTISRYENRNDTTSSQELQKIGQSYIKYKGNAEINLKIVSELNTWNVGEIVSYNAPISELSTTYMVKSKQISMYLNANKIIYTYNLTSNYNCENAVNYFDNQRAKNQGNIGEGETITRNIDLESTALIKFYDTSVEEVQIGEVTTLDFQLDGILI